MEGVLGHTLTNKAALAAFTKIYLPIEGNGYSIYDLNAVGIIYP